MILPLSSVLISSIEEILTSEGLRSELVARTVQAIRGAATTPEVAEAIRGMVKGCGGRSREAARAASRVLWDWLDMDAELAAVPTVAEEAPEWKVEALGTGQSLFGTYAAWVRREELLSSRYNRTTREEGDPRE